RRLPAASLPQPQPRVLARFALPRGAHQGPLAVGAEGPGCDLLYLERGADAFVRRHVLDLDDDRFGAATEGVGPLDCPQEGLAVRAQGEDGRTQFENPSAAQGPAVEGLLRGGRLPEPGRAVLAAGEYGPAVGAEGQGPDVLRMQERRADVSLI